MIEASDADKKFDIFIRAIVSVAKWSLTPVPIPSAFKDEDIKNMSDFKREQIDRVWKCDKCGSEARLPSLKQVPRLQGTRGDMSIYSMGLITCTNPKCGHTMKFRHLRANQAPRERK